MHVSYTYNLLPLRKGSCLGFICCSTPLPLHGLPRGAHIQYICMYVYVYGYIERVS